MKIKRTHRLSWHQGPRFSYSVAKKKFNVNVVGSSWPIHGVPLAKPIRDVLEEFKYLGRDQILDFGAGSWLRYVSYIRKKYRTFEVYAVEFDEAFHGMASTLKATFSSHVTFWTPSSFENQRGNFDLILLVNVLNTIPEDEHQREVFKCLSENLSPSGWMVVYQRIWTKGENPSGALPYGNGWFIPQSQYGYYTYRSATGASWFKAQAKACGLNHIMSHAEEKFASNNTLFKVWEKQFD